MFVKRYFLVLLLTTLCVSSLAQANARDLNVRQLPNYEIEAVITYDTAYCYSDVTAPSSIQVIDFEVIIVSPQMDPRPCTQSVMGPSNYVEATTNIGTLAPGRYTVSWSQTDYFSFSVPFVVTATGFLVQPEIPIPATSTWAIILLILGILVGVRSALRTRPPLV